MLYCSSFESEVFNSFLVHKLGKISSSLTMVSPVLFSIIQKPESVLRIWQHRLQLSISFFLCKAEQGNCVVCRVDISNCVLSQKLRHCWIAESHCVVFFSCEQISFCVDPELEVFVAHVENACVPEEDILCDRTV